jgi:hypothetical protein
MEEAVGRYLEVFLPFIATLICAHYIVRQSASPFIARTDLASPRTFHRALVATAIALPLIIAVDLATGGDLFLHPRFPESQLLITLLLVAVLLVFTLGRSLAPLARRFKLIG